MALSTKRCWGVLPPTPWLVASGTIHPREVRGHGPPLAWRFFPSESAVGGAHASICVLFFLPYVLFLYFFLAVLPSKTKWNDFFLVPLMSISRAVFVLNAPPFLLLSPFMTTLSLDVCPEDSPVVF